MELHVKNVGARRHQIDMESHVKQIHIKIQRNVAFDMESAFMDLTWNSVSNQASDTIDTGFHVKRDLEDTV